MKKSLLLIIVSLFVIIATVLVINNQPAKDNTGKLKVAGSIFPVFDITRNIAGDKIEVVQIMPSDVSEHTYEPSVQDQQKISGSVIVFKIGQQLDNWVDNLASTNAPEAKIISLDNNISLLPFSEDEHEEEQGEFDPHYWLSPLNAIIMAQSITKELQALDPANSSFYQNQLTKYSDELMSSFIKEKARVDLLENKQIITFHEAFSYFAKDLGLEVIGTIEPFPGKEPTAAYLNELASTLSENKVKALFKEPQLSDSLLKSLADDYGVSIQTLDPLGGIDGRNSYISNFEYNVETLVNALD